MSAVCGDIRKEWIGYSLFFCGTLSGIAQCVKPRVRAEPDEPKAPYSSVTPLRLRIDSLHSMITEYASCTIRSHMASARMGSPILSLHPGTSNCEQKIVDAVLYLASAISSRSRASVSLSGYSSHSSNMSNDGFLYC